MTQTTANARRLLSLFERMRSNKMDGAISHLHALNLSFSHVRAMHMLAAAPHLQMKDLAEKLGFTPPSVTALTRRLVATGMVQRQPHADDSRVALLSLTDDGRALLHELYEEQLRGMELLLEGLAPEEQTQFLDLMERAVSTLVEGRASGKH